MISIVITITIITVKLLTTIDHMRESLDKLTVEST